jgi:outer membrane protein TolC
MSFRNYFMHKIFCLSFLLISVLPGSAQTGTRSLMLTDVIRIASQQSLDAFRNKNMYLASYWEFRNFKADNLPTLSFTATPLDYTRSMQKVYNFDENRDEYKPRDFLNSDLALSLSQNIGLTGGRIFAQSELNLTHDLSGDKITSWNSTPVSIGFSQSLNGYNALRWRAKIEPLKFEKAKKEFIQSREEVAIKATRRFFDLVDAQIEVSISRTNLSNADTLYRIGTGRFQAGTITQDDLLNLELGLMNAKLALNRANIELERSRADLNSFLGFEKNISVDCLIPLELPGLQISASEALSLALDNNPDIMGHLQRLLEEDRKVKQAEAQTGFNADLYALYGLNQNADNFKDVYLDPLERQRFRVGVTVPVLDWGRRKGQLSMAKSNREVVKTSINQERIDFEQNIIMNVMEFNLQGEQVRNTAKADTIAKMGFDVTKQRFLIGKLDVTKLNLARNDLDQARRAYILALRSYWTYYYTLRLLTLYDFDKRFPLSEDFENLLNN